MERNPVTGLVVSQMCFAKAVTSPFPFIFKYFVSFDSGHMNSSQKRGEGKTNFTETWET